MTWWGDSIISNPKGRELDISTKWRDRKDLSWRFGGRELEGERKSFSKA